MDFSYRTYSSYAFYDSMNYIEGKQIFGFTNFIYFDLFFLELLICYGEVLLILVMQLLLLTLIILLFIDVCEEIANQ